MHTIPIAGLIWYNNNQELVHDEDLETVMRIFFIALGTLSLIEIIYFFCAKAQNENPEIDLKTMKPRAS